MRGVINNNNNNLHRNDRNFDELNSNHREINIGDVDQHNQNLLQSQVVRIGSNIASPDRNILDNQSNLIEPQRNTGSRSKNRNAIASSGTTNSVNGGPRQSVASRRPDTIFNEIEQEFN